MLAAERRHDDLESQLRGHLPLLEQALTIDGDCGAAYLSRTGARDHRRRGTPTSAAGSSSIPVTGADSSPTRNSSTGTGAATRRPVSSTGRCGSTRYRRALSTSCTARDADSGSRSVTSRSPGSRRRAAAPESGGAQQQE
jgi:hypothetical protein